MRTSLQRGDKYAAKATSSAAVTTIGLTVAARLPGMKSGFQDAVNSIVPMQMMVVDVLDAQSVPAIKRGAYHAYALELWKKIQNESDPAATVDAQIIHDKWESRGLTTAILVDIALQVFNLIVT